MQQSVIVASHEEVRRGGNAVQVAELPLRDFLHRFGNILPRLINLVCSDAVRTHPVWGKNIPFNVPSYGDASSIGHCVRPDIIMTEHGRPVICELDFVPSGRGITFAALPFESEQVLFLDAFADWYVSMGVDSVAYATGTTTVCWDEQVLFAKHMNELYGLAIDPINIDRDAVHHDFVDRLFYRSELERPLRLPEGARIATAEPFLDSKAVLAFVHDPAMTGMLENALGVAETAFLREAFIETRMFDPDSHRCRLDLGDRHKEIILKNSDVETDECWGSRGTIIGCAYTNTRFRRILEGDLPRSKCLGLRPVVQQFHRSVDFTDLWDGVVGGRLASVDGSEFGKRVDDCVHRPATKPVRGCVRPFLLIDRVNSKSFFPYYGVLTLRQNDLVHGAGDSMFCAFKLV